LFEFRQSMVLGAALAAACGGGALRYEYAFKDAQHHDHFVKDGPRDPLRLRPEQRAILLVPRGLTVGSYVGPARVFFAPGKRSFGAGTAGDPDQAVAPGRFFFELELERGHAYAIRATETEKKVDYEIVDLGPEQYRRLHEGDAVQASLPKALEMPAPALPLGVQADGSVVIPADEHLGIPALHFSAPLFSCPPGEDSPGGLVALVRGKQPARKALASSHVLAACPEAERGEPWQLGSSLRRCAYEHFGSKGLWQPQDTPDPGICSTVLGASWSLPSLALLEQLSHAQLVALMQHEGKPLREPLAPSHVFALSDEGKVTPASYQGDVATDGFPVWLRCVREPTGPAPTVGSEGRCSGSSKASDVP
jgi:hypothetical protein